MNLSAYQKRYILPSIFQAFPTVIAAQSTRLGGVSAAPYTSLNLGLHTNDQLQSVQQNRALFFSDLGFTEAATAGGFQVHQDQIKIVDKPGQVTGYDAFITQQKGILLSVTIADCTPILLYDPTQKVIAAIHAGWKGTRDHIVDKTLQKMIHTFGTMASDCYAYIGACIDECTFEVDADVADHFATDYKRWDAKLNKYFVDLKQANKDQLLLHGIPAGQIEISPYSTVSHNQYFFSHRKEQGQTGRMLAVIGIK